MKTARMVRQSNSFDCGYSCTLCEGYGTIAVDRSGRQPAREDVCYQCDGTGVNAAEQKRRADLYPDLVAALAVTVHWLEWYKAEYEQPERDDVLRMISNARAVLARAKEEEKG